MRRARLPALLCTATSIGLAIAAAGSSVCAQENFSAKPAPQLFSSDCTGSGCHSSPQGLAKGMSQGGLASFLRAHYTNSRESAAAIAGYLVGLANVPAPRDPRARRQAEPAQPPGAKPPARSAARTEEPGPASAPASRAKPEPAPKPDGATKPEPKLTPAQQRAALRAAQRAARQAPAAPVAPEPPAPPPEPPKPKQWDIFD